MHAAPRPIANSPLERIDETERLLGVPFSEDEQIAEALRDNPARIDPLVFGELKLIHDATVSILEERAFGDRAANHYARIRFLAGQLALRNNAQRAEPANYTSSSQFRPYQSEVVRHGVDFLLKQPAADTLTEVAKRPGAGPMELLTKGATIVSSTGSGKTVVMAGYATRFGIGQPLSAHSKDNASLLIVAGNLDAVDQLAGVQGDDTFRRFSGIKHVTRYFGGEKNNAGTAVVTTRRSFADAFRDGRLDGRGFDLLMIDEVHHLTESDFLRTFLNHWRGPVFGFSATPAYRVDKDARLILPVVISRGSLSSDIEDGILNGARLYTCAVEPQWIASASEIVTKDTEKRQRFGRYLLNRAVADYVIDRVRKGRRGIVFCDEADRSKHARDIRDLIRQGYMPDGYGGQRPIVAETLGSFQAKSKDRKNIGAYHDRACEVLTTVRTGIESLNADIDFVVDATQTRSWVKKMQMIGRGMRLSGKYPITEYAEFFIPDLEDSPMDPFVMLWDVFGLDTVYQGYVIAPRHGGRGYASSWPVRSSLSPNNEADNDLPDSLQVYAQKINLKKISDIVIAPDIKLEVPPEYVSIEHLMEVTGRAKSSIINRLLKASIVCSGKWDMEEGVRIFRRYYPPEAEAYLLSKPVAPPVTSDFLSLEKLAKRIGCSKYLTQLLIDGVNNQAGDALIARVPLTASTGREYLYYEAATAVPRLEAALAEYPRAGRLEDIALNQLVGELGCSKGYVESLYAELDIEPSLKRGIENFGAALHLTQAEAESVREVFYSTPLAEADDITTREILHFSNWTNKSINKIFTPQERTELQTKRLIESPGTICPMLPREIALQAIERLLPVALPAHLMPESAIWRMIQGGRNTSAKAVLKKFPVVYLRLPGKGGNSKGNGIACYTWMAVKALEEKYGLKEGVASINLRTLPFNDSQAYAWTHPRARAIQELYVLSDKLVKPPTFKEVQAAVEALVRRRTAQRATYLAIGDRAEQWRRRARQPVTVDDAAGIDDGLADPQATGEAADVGARPLLEDPLLSELTVTDTAAASTEGTIEVAVAPSAVPPVSDQSVRLPVSPNIAAVDTLFLPVASVQQLEATPLKSSEPVPLEILQWQVNCTGNILQEIFEANAVTRQDLQVNSNGQICLASDLAQEIRKICKRIMASPEGWMSDKALASRLGVHPASLNNFITSTFGADEVNRKLYRRGGKAGEITWHYQSTLGQVVHARLAILSPSERKMFDKRWSRVQKS